jgi:CRISPR-associated endonuclease/helicase Cas3
MLKKEEEKKLEKLYEALSITEAYHHQQECWKLLENFQNIILKVGTGGGKTESILLPSISSKKRIIIIYPAKALLEDQELRLKKIIEKLSGTIASPLYLTVDTGDEQDRSLYRADIILTTIDKFLYRVFGYGSARWGYIYPKRIASWSAKPTILVFDEAHVYENIALTHFLFLIDKLTYENQIQTAILSATLPDGITEMLTTPEFFPLPQKLPLFTLVSEKHGEVKKGKCVYVDHLQSNDVVEKAVEYFRKGKRVIIVVNRVYSDEHNDKSCARGMFDRLKERGVKDFYIYHGHQFPTQRKEQLKKLLANQTKPFILLTTYAFEVGIDISCDVMFTEICKPDSFIQRIGRCARRANEKGYVYIFGSPKSSLSKALLDKLSKTKNQIIDENIKNEINELNAQGLSELKKLRKSLIYTSDLALYQYVYDFVPESFEAWGKGILATRSWLPTVYVQWGNDENNRLRLSAEYFLRSKLMDDWWIEYRDDESLTSQGKIRKSNNPGELRLKLEEKKKNKLSINAKEYNLVVKPKSECIDSDFGLIERILAKHEKKWGGLGIQQHVATYKVPERNKIKEISLTWYQPEEESE